MSRGSVDRAAVDRANVAQPRGQTERTDKEKSSNARVWVAVGVAVCIGVVASVACAIGASAGRSEETMVQSGTINMRKYRL